MTMQYLRSFLPWIVVSLLIGSIDVRYALLAGLVAAVALIAYQRGQGRAWDAQVVEISAALFFAVATTVAFAASGSAFVEHYASAGSSLWLALTAWGSLAIGRPFTLGIARTTVPAEFWNNPLFLRVNKVITAVWAASFTITGVGSALLHHYQPDNGGARTALTIAGIVIPILFTVRYPAIARARHLTAVQQGGAASQEGAK
ncbi:hypothetical protein AB5J56_24765 [Streptomyces sp. R21]|uniref:Intracellular septation protein A n=1 Tax=Streptomyces sp. R21 TaxID=3238627 RepID=A0AB39PCB2_9ACTN